MDRLNARRLVAGIFGLAVLSMWIVLNVNPDWFPDTEQGAFVGLMVLFASFILGIITLVRGVLDPRAELFIPLGLAIVVAIVIAWYNGFDKVLFRLAVAGTLSIAGGIWACAYCLKPQTFTLRKQHGL